MTAGPFPPAQLGRLKLFEASRHFVLEDFMNKNIGFLVLIGSLGVAACDVDQTREAEAPTVDVDADAGQLPSYDVDAPEVNVGTKNVVVEVPTVDVDPATDDDAAATNRQ